MGDPGTHSLNRARIGSAAQRFDKADVKVLLNSMLEVQPALASIRNSKSNLLRITPCACPASVHAFEIKLASIVYR